MAYKIKIKGPDKDGKYHVYENGDWTLSGTLEEAEQEVKERTEFHRVWLATYGNRNIDRPSESV